MKHNDIDIGNWEYDGPKDFIVKLIDKFGTPSYIEKCPITNEAYSVTFKNIDGFDMVRVVDSNTNKLHPYPAKIYVEGSMYFPVPKGMIGLLKMASPTIMIDELNQLVTGKCASLTIAAATVQFVIDAVNGVSPPTREEYDKRLMSILDDNKLMPEISWWEDGLNEMNSVKSIKDEKNNEFQLVIKDGHTDVASAKRQMKKIQEDVIDMYNSLMSKNNEDDLPSWWTNKLAVSSAYLNSLRDYIVYETNEAATVDAEDSSSSLLVFRDDDIDVVPVDNSEMLPPSVLQAREQNNAS
jgi:hypothetical protein